MGVCDIPLMSQVCTVVDAVSFASNPGKSITDGIGAWIAKSMGELAASAVDLASKAVDQTTAIDLSAPWFRDNYQLVLPIGLILTVGTFCAQLILAAWRRDERALAQAAWGTMTGVLFSFCAISFTAVAVTTVDALSAGLFKAANTSVDDAIRRLVKVSQLGAMFPLGWAIPSLVAVGCAIGAFLYWGVMVARKVGVLVLVALAAFAGAGGGWEVAKRWRRGWIEATATLVVSKLLMTVVFLVGVSAIGNTDAKDGLGALSDAMAGIVIMVLVLLCPYAVYKFVHWATDGGGHDDLHRTGVAGVAVAAGAAKTAGSLAMQMGTGTPAPQGPSQVPGMNGGGTGGIDPTGRISKEGIDAGPPQPQTKFRFGEDPNAEGDRGRALVTRPGLPALITRPAPNGGSGEAQDDGGKQDASVAPSTQGIFTGTVTPPSTAPSTPSAPPVSSSAPPAPAPAPEGRSAGGPSPAGTSAPDPVRFVYPHQPPASGS
ncbi:ATP-binding protein [Streptomyces sp. SP17BM10]|uniref:SCO6881 family protein n=1 Tax=Streptomyces sp. SP17BM10 TaxID=3002530 RepID=UPI002E7A9D5C|nr:ATP-binding protein [Streptomyces sp. SP17BM10]MEE1786898.1 ATP-binding protein [Streptomyces sp. SP17BM10]